ncbi:hypothetical protein [Burkholderia stagnalis]
MKKEAVANAFRAAGAALDPASGAVASGSEDVVLARFAGRLARFASHVARKCRHHVEHHPQWNSRR